MPKSWLIMGASNGFGREIVARLLERGDRVVATVHRSDALDDMKSAPDGSLVVGLLDIADGGKVNSFVDSAFTQMDTIDVVVSNAGYSLIGAAEELTDLQIYRQVNTNLIGSIHVARAAIRNFRRQGGGRIIQTSSFLGQAAYPTMGVYAATKWGIEGFYEGTIPEIAPFGIQVTLVEPGGTRAMSATDHANWANILDAYQATTAGEFRRFVVRHQDALFRGDIGKIASEVINSADQFPAPRRLTLGSDAYAVIHEALSERLAMLEEQKDLAHSTDAIG